MSLILRSNLSALVARNSTSFGASGGTAPYTYSVLPDGAGGSIDSSSGMYTAPDSESFDPAKAYDTVQVTDNAALTATKKILVAPPYRLLCHILQTQMGLAEDRVYLWNQKILEPKDNGIYIPVKMLWAKPFGNTKSYDSSGPGVDEVQTTFMQATMSIDIISRGMEALYRKEEVLMAIQSDYSEQIQEANAFSLAILPTSFINLAQLDGTAIPYRFNLSVVMTYKQTKQQATDYFNDFSALNIYTDPETPNEPVEVEIET